MNKQQLIETLKKSVKELSLIILPEFSILKDLPLRIQLSQIKFSIKSFVAHNFNLKTLRRDCEKQNLLLSKFCFSQCNFMVFSSCIVYFYFSAARAYCYLDHFFLKRLAFCVNNCKVEFSKKHPVLEPRTAQNPRPRRAEAEAKDNTVEAKTKDFTNLSSRPRTSSRTTSLAIDAKDSDLCSGVAKTGGRTPPLATTLRYYSEFNETSSLQRRFDLI